MRGKTYTLSELFEKVFIFLLGTVVTISMGFLKTLNDTVVSHETRIGIMEGTRFTEQDAYAMERRILEQMRQLLKDRDGR